MMIKGISVILWEPTQTGTDGFNRPIMELSATTVDNVLVEPSSSDDIATSTDLYGKKAVYVLGIPKGDSHEWEDRKVTFFDKDWHTFGFTIEGIENMVPLDWHKKVMVERYG